MSRSAAQQLEARKIQGYRSRTGKLPRHNRTSDGQYHHQGRFSSSRVGPPEVTVISEVDNLSASEMLHTISELPQTPAGGVRAEVGSPGTRGPR